MPTIKRTGEKVTWKQFFQRWKQGIQEVTPLQQCFINQLGYITVFIGIIWGLIISIITKQYWLSIILSGSLIISSTSFLSNWQRKEQLKKIDKMIKEQNIEVLNGL